MDVWYIDDSCVATPPELFDEALRALDRELEARGVARGRGEDIKSTARIICPEDEVARWTADQGWATEYVLGSCKVLEPNAPVEYLGAVAGGRPEAAKSMQQAFRKTADKRAGVATQSPGQRIDHAPPHDRRRQY